MVNVDELFELANSFVVKQNVPMAVQLYNEVLVADPKYGMVHINMAKILNGQQNFQGEYQALKNFMKCPLTPITFKLMAGVEQRIGELEKQFGAQPSSQPVQK